MMMETTRRIPRNETPTGSETLLIDSPQDVSHYCDQILNEAPLLTSWLPQLNRDPIELNSHNNQRCRLNSQTKVVVVDLEGINLSRTGQITIISVATSRAVYLFDIIGIATEGVKTIRSKLLQNSSVLKVLFDCRKDTDALYHQYQTTVHPLCDLQVSCLTYLLPPDRWDYLIGMAKCFSDRFLNLLSEEELRMKEKVGNKTFDNKGGDPNLWSKRPIDPDLVVYSAIDVRHTLTALNKLSCDSIVLGCTVGCLRRDRAVIAPEPSPPSAECDFKDLLEIVDWPQQREHSQSTHSGVRQGLQNGSPHCNSCRTSGHTTDTYHHAFSTQNRGYYSHQQQPTNLSYQQLSSTLGHYSCLQYPQYSPAPNTVPYAYNAPNNWMMMHSSQSDSFVNSPISSLQGSTGTNSSLSQHVNSNRPPVQNSPQRTSTVTCYTCGGVGHVSRKCPSRLHNVRSTRM